MKFKCEKCGTRYTIAEEKVRNRVLKIRCKVCENVIAVRDPEMGGPGPAAPAPLTGPIPSPTTAGRPATTSRAGSMAPVPNPAFVDARTSLSDPLGPAADVEWYAAPESGQVGPMPLERLRDLIRKGEVKAEDFVWNESMPDWVAAQTAPELHELFRPKAVPKPPPLPPPPPAPSHTERDSGAARSVRKRAPIDFDAMPDRPSAPQKSVRPLSEELPALGARRKAESEPPLPRGPEDSPNSLLEELFGERETREAPGPRRDSGPLSLPRPAPPPPEPEPRSELDVDLLSLLGAPSGQVEASPTELMPSSRSPTRPVEQDELAAIMAAEMAAPPTAPAPSIAGLSKQLSAVATTARSAERLDAVPTRAAKSRGHEENFGFGDLGEQPTTVAGSHSGGHVVRPQTERKGGLPWGVLVAAGLILVVGGVALGIWLAPHGGGPNVAAAAPEAPPSVAAAVTAPPTVAAPVPTAPTAAPMSVAVAAPSEPVEPAHEETPIHKAVAPHAGAEKAPAPASHASAFAGLDAERGNSATPVAPKSDGKAADLPGGLDQAEITGVIKRNLKAVQGCYQRQLKKDDSMTGGRATIRFRILADGRAQNVEMERKFDGTVLKECIITVVERWVFPPFSGDPIPVEFPVIFTATL